MKNDFLIAITQLCAEKNLSKEVVIDALEVALASAYKRNFGSNQEVVVRMQPATGEFKVFIQQRVVDVVEDPKLEISVEDASKAFGRKAQVDEIVEHDGTPSDFGRIAAQTARQVVLQRLRDAEREVVFEEYIDKSGDIVSGIVQRLEPRQIVIDLGKAEAILPSTEQVPGEVYRLGQRIKAYLVEVHRTPKGPQLIASRTHRNLLKRLFELEVPEIYNGTVEIKAIAREPGSRSKVAVAARQPGIDPVGACVGLRGIRIQNIVSELNNEKIDVIEWHADTPAFVAKALSPAQVVKVETNEEEKTAKVVVPDRQLSLAIGKEGQNARLAAKLTGWRIDIQALSAYRQEEAERLAIEEEERAAAAAALPPEPEVAAVSEPEEAPVVEEPELLPVAAELPVEAEIVVPIEEPQAAPPVEYVIEEPVVVGVGAEKRQVRFAEEILTDIRDGKKKVKGKRDVGREEEEAARAPKKAQRRQRVYFEDDEEEEYEDILRRIK